MDTKSNDKSDDKENGMPWFVREDTDRTLRLIGGLIAFLAVMFCTFYLEMRAPADKKYLTPELLHSIFTFVAGWVAGAASMKR